LGKIFEMKDFEKRRVEKKAPIKPGTIHYLRPEESELLYPVIFLSPTEYDLILDNHLFPAVGFLSEEEVFSLDDFSPDFYKMAKDKRIISAWMLLRLGISDGNRDS
jgi:hypothetical protein